jgi:hypothetical protein
MVYKIMYLNLNWGGLGRPNKKGVKKFEIMKR